MNSEIVKKLNEVIASISSPMTQINKGRKVAEIKRRLNEIVCSPTVVLVCGEFKRGKSTFVNALIGRSICPTDTEICTSVVSVIRYGENPKAIRFYGDFSNLKSQEINIDDIERYTVGNAANIDNTVSIEITLPLEELKKGLVIIDTPGLGGLDPRHSALTNYFLPQADMAIFMTDVNEPLTSTELAFYRDKVLRFAKKSLIVLNKSDLKEASAVEDIRKDTISKVQSECQFAPDVISVSSAECIMEEEGLGNFPQLRGNIDKLVSGFKDELIIGLRDDLSEELDLAILPLQMQLNQIESPKICDLESLAKEKTEIELQIQDLSNPQSPFRIAVNDKISEEREKIILHLNTECVKFSTDGFNELLNDSHATSEGGGMWLGKQIKSKINELSSEITLQLNKSFERISQLDDFAGLLNFKAKKYIGQVVVKEVNLQVPVHKRVLSSTPGWGVAMMGLCVLGTGPLGAIASVLAGSYVAYRNASDVGTTTQQNELRRTYQAQIETEKQNLRTYVESRFSEFQREWFKALGERANEYKDCLKQTIGELTEMKKQINISVNKKNMLENQIRPLKLAKENLCKI